MSANMEQAGTYQDSLLPEQRQHFGSWPGMVQYWPPVPLLTDSSVRNSKIVEGSPRGIDSRYSYANRHFMAEEISPKDMAPVFGLSNQPWLSSAVSEVSHGSHGVIYQAPSVNNNNNAWQTGPIAGSTQGQEHAKQHSRKRKLDNIGATGGAFFPKEPTSRRLSIHTMSQFQEPKGNYRDKPFPPGTTGPFPPTLPNYQSTAGIWGTSFPNLYQPQLSTHLDLSHPVPGFEPKESFNPHIESEYAVLERDRQRTHLAKMVDVKSHKNSIDIDQTPGPASPSKKRKRSTSSTLSDPIYVPEDLQKVQAFFSEFLDEDRLSALPCSHATSGLSSIFTFIKCDDRRKVGTVAYSSEEKTCLFRCSSCKMTVCAGCGAKVGKIRAPFSDLSHSCVDSHLLSFAIDLAKIDARWLLKESDTQSLVAKNRTSTPNLDPVIVDPPTLPPATLVNNITLPPPHSAFSILSSPSESPIKAGVGYGAGELSITAGRNSVRKPPKALTKFKRELGDKMYLTELFAHIAKLANDKAGDLSMATLLAKRKDLLVSLMRISYLPELVKSLVGNDSIIEIEAAGAWDMYTSCFELLRVFCVHEPLLGFLVTESGRKKSSSGIANLINLPELDPLRGFATRKKRTDFSKALDSVKFELVEGSSSSSQSILCSFRRLVKHCQSFMDNAFHIPTDPEDESIQRLLAFCADVNMTSNSIELGGRVDELMRGMDQAKASPLDTTEKLTPSSSKREPSRTPSSSQKYYQNDRFGISATVRWECKNALSDHLRFKYSDMVTETHIESILKAAMRFDTSKAPSPGLMRQLLKELTVLTTALPAGIYLRVQEDRPQYFKALIVGPESSPYALGLYEFDFTIPPEYPNSPPAVHFKTTGGGRVRFNPNLYENGKVCLSILGTWAGDASEQWQPGISTISQVLLSIQSMIFCADPYYNEPGSEKIMDTTASKMYNEEVQSNNMNIAMMGWLSYDGVWNDVVQTHFLANFEEILSVTQVFVDEGGLSPLWKVENGRNLDKRIQHRPENNPSVKLLRFNRKNLEERMGVSLPIFRDAGLWKKQT
ncbi:hypothetical protein TWF481_004392 [Arthrobotrys musiformis]|uniref:UBC core domain-containing protein n=1 Tax=Arthrobotrys musiformis TaxID=47236 RepID=A0AAV9WKJ2_9PEZI